ncbi:MAG: SRPBCC family protein [Rhodomicrobium sp.]|nr:SRPBCC family protein [Rhodomicrobium sp.]
MKFFRGLLITLLVLAAIVIGGGLLLPGAVHVERSTVIKADAAAIFPYLTNYRRFNEWSPWAPRDLNAEYTFAGPEEGVGAKMSWRSDKREVGSGSQEIVAVTPNEKVVTALDFGDMGTAEARFDLAPESDGTKVTWSLDTNLPANPLARWMGLLLDSLIGTDYEEGLARLKAKVESGRA